MRFGFGLLRSFFREVEKSDPYKATVDFAHRCEVDRAFSHDLLKNAVAAAAAKATGTGFPRTLMEVRVPGTIIDIVADGVPIEVKADPDAAVKGAAWKKQAYYAAKALGTNRVIFTNGVKVTVVEISGKDARAYVVREIDELDPWTPKMNEAARLLEEALEECRV